MPKGVFSIFKKDPLLIYDLVIFITVVYLIILLLLNNFEFVLRKQSNFIPNFYAVTYLGHSKLDFSFPSGPDFKLHAGGRTISIIHYSV